MHTLFAAVWLTGLALAGDIDIRTPPGPLEGVEVTVDLPAVDILSGGQVAWSVETAPGLEVELRVNSGLRVVHTATVTTDATGHAEGTWNGRDLDGRFVRPGRILLVAEAGDLGGRATTRLVRPGVVGAAFTDDGGVSSLRVPLYWHGDRVLQDVADEVASVEALEVDRALVDLPPVTAELRRHGQVDGAEPVAYHFASRPVVDLRVATAAHTLFPSTGLDGAGVRLRAPGWTVQGDATVGEGAVITLVADAPLGTTVGITDDVIPLEFVVDGVDGEQIITTQRVPFRAYRLYGPPTFGHPGDLYSPWVEAVDEVLLALEGTAGGHDPIADAIVDWAYFDLGLRYDTVYGASRYSDYGSGWNPSWDEPHFYMSDFVDRRFGSTVNCSDAGNIVTTYANMLGVEMHHLIIHENFWLNEIKAIGIGSYTSCPFGPGACGFSYHAVTTDDGGATIWDATLALDGDGNPGASPSTELIVQGIGGPEYLDRLVRSGFARYVYESRGTIQ